MNQYQQAFEALLYAYGELAPLIKDKKRRDHLEKELAAVEQYVSSYEKLKYSPRIDPQRRLKARGAIVGFKVKLGFILDEKRMLIKTIKKRTLDHVEAEMGIGKHKKKNANLR